MRFVTEQELRDQWQGGECPAVFHLPQDVRLTPAARQYAADRRVQVVEGVPEGGASILSAAPIPVGISARHVHLSPKHLEMLFGSGYALQALRPLSQPGQFAAQETVVLAGPKGSLSGVRVLGPARDKTQVELARTDGFAVGVQPPVRLSGNTVGTPGITLIGPNGAVILEEGIIVAKRHIHMSPADAEIYRVADGETVRLATTLDDRPLTFGGVVVRVSPNFHLEIHLDTDEANAAELSNGDLLQLLKN